MGQRPASSAASASSIRFERITPAHDAALRRILRQSAVPGRVSLATTREPDYFAAADLLGAEQGVVAIDAARVAGECPADDAGDAVIGMCHWREQRVHLQGQPCTAHYLGGLRVLPSHQKRLSILKGGFAAVRRYGPQGAQGQALWYTSIAADNRNARRLLEAGLPGLPRYRLLGELWTLAVPARRTARTGGAGLAHTWTPVQPDELPRWCEAHKRLAARHAFSAVVDVLYMQRLMALGARPCALWRHGPHGPDLAATMAIWPQNTFKQTRVMAYGWPLNALRPLYNAWARITRGAPLPAVGQVLDAAFMAFWAWAPDVPLSPAAQIAAACALCPHDWLFAGLPAGTALGPLARAQRYETRIYQVLFDGDEALPPLDQPLLPEVAWL